MADRFGSFVSTPESYGSKLLAVTPGNTDFGDSGKCISLLTAGNVTIVPINNADGETFQYVDVPSGFSPPVRVRRVTAATATVVIVTD